MHFDDARRANRKIIDLPCELVMNDWDTPIGHSMMDASPFGAWVRSSFPAAVGDIMVCCFEPEGWERRRGLTLFAQVKRVLRPRQGTPDRGMALEFLDITLQEQMALQRCLSPYPARQPQRWLS